MSKTTRTGKTPRRSAKAVVAARVEEVLYCLLNGAAAYELRIHAREQKWNVSDRQLERYTAAAYELLAGAAEGDRDMALRRHLGQRRALFARCVSDGDHRTALAVAKDEAELLNLYPSRRVEVTGKDGQAVKVETMSDDDRAVALARIIARFGLPTGGPGGPFADRDATGAAD